MIANPVLPVGVLVALGILLGGFVAWRLVAARRDPSTLLRWLARLAMVALLLVVAARPTIPTEGQGPTASGGLEVYFAVDTTSSMGADDFGDGLTRLDGVRSDLGRLVDELQGAQFSLVTFDAVAVQRVPLTTDSSAMVSAASVLKQEITSYSRGSSIDEPVAELAELLSEAQKLAPDVRRVLFYLGDGEQTADVAPGGFEQLAPYLDGGAVLGYGTEEGGRMLEYLGERPTQFGDTATSQPVDPTLEEPPAYIQDYSGGDPVDALSRIDEAALRDIAQQLGVAYLHRDAATPADSAADGIEVGELTVEDGEPDSVVELYWIFVIPLGVLVLLELFCIGGALAELRATRRHR